MSYLEQLEALNEQVDRATAREASAEAELRSRVRELTAVEAERRGYEEAVGAGELARDPEFERESDGVLGAVGVELKAELDRPLQHLTDRLAERRLAGAKAAVERDKEAVTAYCRAHADDLVAELAVGDDERVAELLAAIAEVNRLLAAQARARDRASGVLHRAGRPDLDRDQATFDLREDLRVALGRAQRAGAPAFTLLGDSDHSEAAA